VLAVVFFLEQKQLEFCSTIDIRVYRMKRKTNKTGKKERHTRSSNVFGITPLTVTAPTRFIFQKIGKQIRGSCSLPKWSNSDQKLFQQQQPWKSKSFSGSSSLERQQPWTSRSRLQVILAACSWRGSSRQFY
jgi:hypothetical protein